MSTIILSGPIQRVDGHCQYSGTGAEMVFKPGDRIEAKVLRIATDQRVLMEFGRFRALAHIDHFVKPGQTLVLKVLDSGSPVHMQIMADEVVADRPLMPQINLAHALSMAEKRELGQLLNRFIDS